MWDFLHPIDGGYLATGHAAYMLARVQFGFTIAFHIALAAISIGLSSFLMVLEALWLRTGRRVYIDIYNYWLKIVALNFAVGAVTGVVMEYQVGTNWGGLSVRTGAVIGPLLLYEVMVAFFLEAGFLGIMLFGMKRVGPKVHFLSTCVVAFGSLFSAFWILSAISWMQTPDGFEIDADGHFIPQDWWQIIFNPSFPYRLVHMVLAAFLVTAFMVAAFGAWQMLRRPKNAAARTMFSMALWAITIVAPLQIVAGDQHGENTLEHQPQKLAAMEGDWESGKPGEGEPMILFAVPEMAEHRNSDVIAIPRVASLYLRHNLTGTIKGLNDFPNSDIPYVPIVFFMFRVMAGIGFLMVGVGIMSLVLRWRGSLYQARWFHWSTIAMGPSGLIAMLAGWMVTEVGRQPYVVYGMMRTTEAVSPTPLPSMAISFVTITALYLAFYAIGIVYLLRIAGKPPQEGEAGPDPDLLERTEKPGAGLRIDGTPVA
jgi:cytochrome d ubiquinol oxidase subunit I